MIEIMLACVAMACKDAIYTGLVVSQARGYAVASGAFDALGDLASILVTLAGAGVIIVHGWTVHTVTVLAAMCVTSFFGTIVWTRTATRWMPNQ
jgi:hypothetical protein